MQRALSAPTARSVWDDEGFADPPDCAGAMKVTYFLEVSSSWCYWAEPMWAELKTRYAGRADFGWKIAQMKANDYPTTPAQCDWFYRWLGHASSKNICLY